MGHDIQNLRAAVGRSGFFTLAVGAMVGSGWIVVLGSWLTRAGPGGAVVGFMAGAITMVLIAFCYGELVGRSALAGGEVLFVRDTLGRGPAFLVGWFLTLFTVAVCAFESVVLSSLLHSLIPALGGRTLYSVQDTPVDAASLAIGIAGAGLLGVLHTSGAGTAIRFQNVVTYGFIALLLVLVALGLACGDPHNLSPAFEPTDGKPWTHGALWVFSLCAFFLNGWQSAIHAIEERRAGVEISHAIHAVVAGIVTATLLYCGIILAAASATPWHRIVAQPLPARAAFDALLPGMSLGAVVIVTAAVAVAKTWSSVVWMGSRLLVAMAREGLRPRALGRLDAGSAAPRRAIGVMTVLSLSGPLCGRGALLPLVDMVSICLALSILLCLLVLVKQRRDHGAPPTYRVPGGLVTVWLAFALAASMIGVALVTPLLDHPDRIPVEWVMIGVWAVIGAVCYFAAGQSLRPSPSRARPPA